jgi:hypothetical protein
MTRRVKLHARLVRVAGAVAIAAAVWLVLTAAAVLGYVYGGLGCADGLACLGW